MEVNCICTAVRPVQYKMLFFIVLDILWAVLCLFHAWLLYQRPGTQARVLLSALMLSLCTSFPTPLSALGIFLSFLVSFFLMWLSLGIVTSTTSAFFSSLSTTTISTILSLRIRKPHRILARSFSVTFRGFVHFDFSSPYSAQIFPVYYASHLVMVLQVCRACLHLAPCCYSLSLHLGSCPRTT